MSQYCQLFIYGKRILSIIVMLVLVLVKSSQNPNHEKKKEKGPRDKDAFELHFPWFTVKGFGIWFPSDPASYRSNCRISCGLPQFLSSSPKNRIKIRYNWFSLWPCLSFFPPSAPPSLICLMVAASDCPPIVLWCPHANPTQEQGTRGSRWGAKYSHPFLLRRNLQAQRPIVKTTGKIIKSDKSEFFMHP